MKGHVQYHKTSSRNMKELIFRGETEEDVFQMAKSYVDGYLLNNPPQTYEEKVRDLNLKERN